MGTVTIFLEAYDNTPDYDVLNKLICTWRAHEEMIRAECGIDSVLSEYPGCITYSRQDNGGGVTTQGVSRSMIQHAADDGIPRRAMSAHDVILNNHLNMELDQTYEPASIVLDTDRHEVDDTNIDWNAFIAEQYMKEEENHHGRELLNYDHVDWFNYFGMLGVRTEYYYRYSGTQTIPPCHGKYVPGGNRENTNHWRVMKDPLRISKRQLKEMHRLLRERIAPIDAPVNACKSDTAAKVNSDTGEVNVARPLQSKNDIHFVTFCECDDWQSKWLEDQEWCSIAEKKVRFYDRPYNFVANEF
jgi:Eukaryotic-type carbonic anhydrase